MDDGLAAAHPRLQLTLSHVWPWGLVTIADPDALDPPSGEGPVTADGHWVVLHVAHEPAVLQPPAGQALELGLDVVGREEAWHAIHASLGAVRLLPWT